MLQEAMWVSHEYKTDEEQAAATRGREAKLASRFMHTLLRNKCVFTTRGTTWMGHSWSRGIRARPPGTPERLHKQSHYLNGAILDTKP